MNFRETIAHETAEWLRRDPKALILGVGVADNKGIFGTISLAREEFPDRVIETPLSENMLTGSLLGLAQEGWHPMLVHARADFMTLSTEHLVNSLAKWKYMGGEELTATVRCIIGQGWGNGPQHTQSNAHWFASVPGIDVWMPNSPGDITNLYRQMSTSPGIRTIYEHRRLYETALPEAQTYDDAATDQIVLVGLSASRIDVDKAADMLSGMGQDVRTIHPVLHRNDSNYRQLFESSKPKAILFADISPGGYGLLGEIALQAAEVGIKVGRVSPPSIPVPASEAIEGSWYPSENDIVKAALKLIDHQGQVEIPGQQTESFKPAGGPF
jgi:acetoin:2,6-dichlorophenolindophenol oxidoreductase subunit beta